MTRVRPLSRCLASLALALAAVGGVSCASSDAGSGPEGINRIVFRSAPSVAIAGQPFDPAVQVVIVTPDGDIASGVDVPVRLSLRGSAADTLRGDTLAVPSDGIAVFPGARITRVSSGVRLVATALGTAGAVSEPFEVRPGPPVSLRFTVQPDSAIAGVVLPQLRVEARDVGGNLATTTTGVITVTVATGPAGGGLAGTVSSDLVQGVATFRDLVLARAGTGYVLQAALVGAEGVAPAISRTFSTRPGAAAQLVFDEQPTDALVGQPLSPSPVVLILDAFGNRVTSGSPTVSMQVALGSAGFTLLGTTSVAASNGSATFTNLRPDRASASVRLRAVSTGLQAVVSAPFIVSLP
jgi:hypothetical protein